VIEHEKAACKTSVQMLNLSHPAFGSVKQVIDRANSLFLACKHAGVKAFSVGGNGWYSKVEPI
jgi:hypothetical protein